MLKRREKLMTKLLVLTMCISLMPTTIVFATGESVSIAEGTQGDTVLNDSGDNGEWTFTDLYYSSLSGVVINKIRFYINDNGTAGIAGVNDKTISGTLNIPSRIIFNGKSHNVLGIAGLAFENCTNLENVSIPNGVTIISQSMFRGCSNLKRVIVPSSVTSIEDNGQSEASFTGCSSLEKIDVNEGNTIYKSIDGVLYNKAETKIIIYPSGKKDETYIFPDNIVGIMSYAFKGCKNLKSVEMTDNVIETNIGAFLGCSALENVKLPSNMKIITYRTFSGCSSLKSIEIPKSVTVLDSGAFSGCSSLTNIEIPEGVTVLSAFSGCSSLPNVKIPEGVTVINGFSGCSSLNNVTIPSGATSIGNSAFQGCSNFTNVVIPANVTSIGSSAFQDCTNLTSVTIPASVTKIGIDAFTNCTNDKFTIWVPNNDIRLLLINANVDSSKIKIGAGSSGTTPVSTPVNSITLNTTNLNLTVGESQTLTATVSPSDATNKGLTWKSSNELVATADANGKVTGVAAGSATITCTASDGSGVTATSNVTVTTSTNSTIVKVTGITISGNDTITTNGGTSSFTANISPSTATNKTVTWSCSDTSVANVSGEGVVTAQANGSATITATANDGSGIKESKVITVSGQTTTLKSVDISGTEEVGYKLTAKVNYTGAEPSLKYQWQRANKKDTNYTNISGADGDEYKLKSSDNSKYIKLIVTATIDGQVYTEEDITSRIDSDDDSGNEDTSVKSSKNNSNKVIKPTIYNSSSPHEGVFTNPSGIPINGWINSNGNWYYLDQNGVALTGWINENGNWYYLSPTIGQNRATIQTGWIYDNGKWYFLNSVGIMVSNTTIDGYALGIDGARI